MRRAFPLLVVVLLIASTSLADRADVWLSSSVRVAQVVLTALPDGGCEATVDATVTKSDGGTRMEGTQRRELTGAPRTACLDVLTRSAVLFKTEQGL